MIILNLIYYMYIWNDIFSYYNKHGVSNILIVSTSTQVKNVVLELSPFIENCLPLYDYGEK